MNKYRLERERAMRYTTRKPLLKPSTREYLLRERSVPLNLHHSPRELPPPYYNFSFNPPSTYLENLNWTRQPKEERRSRERGPKTRNPRQKYQEYEESLITGIVKLSPTCKTGIFQCTQTFRTL